MNNRGFQLGAVTVFVVNFFLPNTAAASELPEGDTSGGFVTDSPVIEGLVYDVASLIEVVSPIAEKITSAREKAQEFNELLKEQECERKKGVKEKCKCPYWEDWKRRSGWDKAFQGLSGFGELKMEEWCMRWAKERDCIWIK